jgi:uncharacterized membrane-anchored protein
MNVNVNKVAEVTHIFWVMKICATTLGETAGDLVSMTLNLGYGPSTLILLVLFVLSLLLQLKSKVFHPVLYWFVILTTSTAGTTLSDYMDRTLGLGYANGAMILATGLFLVLAIWRISEKTLSVSNIQNLKAEVFYWVAILFSNTLGTALGDYLADDSGLGFFGGALLIGSLIAVIALFYKLSHISRILLFWLAFILTRPFGATLGDFLTKPLDHGGLGFGTIGSSSVLAISLILLVIYVHNKPVKIQTD